jgi:multiple antibiotic resistance protein
MLDKALSDFLTLWVTIEPIGTVVLLASLSAQLSQTQRRQIALMTAVKVYLSDSHCSASATAIAGRGMKG